MGQVHSRCSSGKQLLTACHDGNTQMARYLLQANPTASCYITCIDRNSPLIVAAGKGHARLVQSILEAAVLSQGLSKAKKRCINHSNSKGQSALMVACISGHAACVEVLVCNGASPLLLDNARHNSALHWAASCCRADCVGRLLGSGAMFQMQSGQLVAIADIPCFDEDNSTLVKFIDRHNGWGLTALHLAAHKGSSSTVRALLRAGASVSSRTVSPTVSVSPVAQPPGSTALHFAAAAEDMSVVLVLLEAQVARNEPDMRFFANSDGDRPLDLARSSSSNPLLLQLLDPSHTLSLHSGPRSGIVLNPGSSLSRVITREGLRQHQALLGLANGTGFRASRRGGGLDQLPHVALGALLQRLKLVLTLEAFALQQELAATAGSSDGTSPAAAAVSSLLAKQQQAKEQQVLAAAAAGDDVDAPADTIGTQIGTATSLDGTLSRTNSSGAVATAGVASAAAAGTNAAGPPAGSSPLRQTGVVHPSSSSSSLAEISPDLSSSGGGADDTQPLTDALQHHQQQHLQQQVELKRHQQQQCSAQAAAQRVRLHTLQQLLVMVNEMLAVLPPSATPTAAGASSGHSSPRSHLAPQQQQQSMLGSSSSAGGSAAAGVAPPAAAAVGSEGGGGWDLLGGLLPRPNSTSQAADGDTYHHQHHQGLLGLLRGGQPRHTSSSMSSSSGGVSSSPVLPTPPTALTGTIPEEMFAAYVTPSLLSSLGAVTKLFVGASSISGQQQQQQQPGLGLLGVWLGCGDNNNSISSGSGAGANTAWWAEQEHALMLLKGVLQTARSALAAALQASAAAASRNALRARQQQQMAHLMASDRPVHSSTLRRSLLGDRLADQGRIRFGSSGGSSPSTRHDHHQLGSTAAFTGGMGLSWGLEATLGDIGAAPSTHRTSRRHHRDRSRRARGEDASGPDSPHDSSGRRHHRHQSRHHRSSRRNRTPRAVDSPFDLPVSASAADAVPPAVLTLSPRSRLSLSAGGTRTTSSSGGDSSQQQPGLFAEQQQQQYLQQLAGILRDQLDAAAAGAAANTSADTHSSNHLPCPFPGTNSSNGNHSDGLQEATTAVLHGDDDVPACADDSDDGAAGASCCSSLDGATCAICMDCTAGLSVSRCAHSLCLQCAYQLCYKAKGLPLCPFCRQPIDGFEACMQAAPAATTAARTSSC